MFSSRELNPRSWSTLILALDSKFPISLRTTPWDEFCGRITAYPSAYPTDSKLAKHLGFLAFQAYRRPTRNSGASVGASEPRWELPLKPMKHSHSNKVFDWIQICWAQGYSARTNQYLPYMRFPWSVIHQQKHGWKGDNSERYAMAIFGC